jgi:hypothetical protein
MTQRDTKKEIPKNNGGLKANSFLRGMFLLIAISLSLCVCVSVCTLLLCQRCLRAPQYLPPPTPHTTHPHLPSELPLLVVVVVSGSGGGGGGRDLPTSTPLVSDWTCSLLVVSSRP